MAQRRVLSGCCQSEPCMGVDWSILTAVRPANGTSELGEVWTSETSVAADGERSRNSATRFSPCRQWTRALASNGPLAANPLCDWRDGMGAKIRAHKDMQGDVRPVRPSLMDASSMTVYSISS